MAMTRAEICKRYREKNPEKIKASSDRYRFSDKGRATAIRNHKKYYSTVNGRLRQCFSGIKQRCNNPKHLSYKNYGGRGIKCFFKSPKEFIDYVTNELQVDPRGLTIDRIDNDGHYERGNIQFVTNAVNQSHRRKGIKYNVSVGR